MLSARAQARDVDLHNYLGECRQLAIEEIRRFVPRDERLGPVLYDLMLDYPLRDAKGLRPALCLATCRALGGSIEAALPSAAILELYHNAFLIHDDVEDGSERRRERATLHREHGVPIAVNVGDGMLALAIGPLLENTRLVGLGKALRILQAISRMAVETAEGQALELDWVRHGCWDVTDDDYREMVVKKTGWYSFIVPMTIGAIVAGADRAQLDILEELGRELSIAFQIRDDVLNLRVEPGRYGKEACGDLWEGKRTLILLHVLRGLDPASRAKALAILTRPRPSNRDETPWASLLDTLVAAGELTPGGRECLEAARRAGATQYKTAEDVRWLFDVVVATRAIEHADALGRAHAYRARAALARASWLAPSVHRAVLEALIDFSIERDH